MTLQQQVDAKQLVYDVLFAQTKIALDDLGVAKMNLAQPPLPPEPEAGSFCIDAEGCLAQSMNGLWKFIDSGLSYTWAEIYPQIKKMWDKDGNEVAL